MSVAPEILTFLFKDGQEIPNNPLLPVVVMKRVGPVSGVDSSEALAKWYEHVWPQNQWRAAWRWGVYDFPHFHSTAHEALGVFRGRATLRIGGSVGVTLIVEAGDVLVLPAGTGHQNLGSSSDFQVVGGYPNGQSADLLRGEIGERPRADARILQVPSPVADPIYGVQGPLMKAWVSAKL